MRQINTIGRYWRKKYHQKVYKVPISISGFTCPNIDGKVARGGCTFCENDSFSPNLIKTKDKFKLSFDTQYNPRLQFQLQELEFQFNKTVNKLKQKFNAKKFIVYFQSYTNTYAPLDTLKTLYEKALSFDNVLGLSIGTRTDCINDDILEYLVSLNKKYEIWIEYGVQSFDDITLKRINRGHDSKNMEYWISRTKEYGLNVCAHLIYGLPHQDHNEDKKMMLDTLYKTIKLNIDSIKFHPLYVTDNTLLANDYKKGKFTPITQKDYIDILIDSIEILTYQYPNISIQRITAGIDDKSLLSPNWCRDKHQIINIIRTKLKTIGLDY